MVKPNIVNSVPDDLEGKAADVDEIVREFALECEPLEISRLLVIVDARTRARYCECHITAEKMIELGTIDVPLDPDEQADYRANREIVEDHVAYQRMRDDAKERRTFSNIVAEFNTTFDFEHPLKIIGGQHRFNAIKEALEEDSINERQGIKVYFALNPEQRLDVQLISNTNIAASSDLFDRMQETLAGPQLRNWCQECGLLDENRDFADRRQLGSALTVRAARTFILNYFKGKGVKAPVFDKTSTTPVMAKTGVIDPDWVKLKELGGKLWLDKKLKVAGKEFAALVQAQRAAFAGKKNLDFEEKALNFAVMSAWAYVAGILHENPQRPNRHFVLKNATGKDPLNATALAKGRHKTDAENYRGLGYRTDAKERGRLVELFFLQAELSIVEKSLLAEREIRLEKGQFVLTDALKMSRLEDRIEFLHRKFSGAEIDKDATWWPKLKSGFKARNNLSHPKGAPLTAPETVKASLEAITEALDTLFTVIYGRPYPGKARALESTFNF
jgi:hypothetical protein